jgi:type II secretory pathway pseudopilin PulG
LVELMVVVLIISMLFLAAVPTYQRVQRRARAAAIGNDFRVYSAALQAYAHEKGSWPPESPAGVMPDGMAGQGLKTDAWTHRTPIGGKFDWENDQVHPGGTSPGGRWRAAIAISSTSDTPMLQDAELFRELDQQLDDGNLETGSFRISGDGGPIFILEP